MSCCPNSIQIILPPGACPDSGTYTASNANITGEGVFFQQSGNEFQFNGITNTDGYIQISLDATNHVIEVNLDNNLISGSIPDATETVKGKAELATQAETNAGADDTRIVTPLKLATRQGTTSLTGLLSLATVLEATTGTNTTKAVTPAGLKAATNLVQGSLAVANAVARGSTTPTYAGQLLFQNDTKVLYSANSTATGDFVLAAMPLDGNIGIGTITLTGGAFNVATSVSFTSAFNWDSTYTTLRIDGLSVPGNSILGTAVLAGAPASYPIASFVSTYNTQDYTLGGFTTQRVVASSGTITLAQLADVVMTLIQDLSDSKKPVSV